MGDELSRSSDPQVESDQPEANGNRIDFFQTELDTCFTLADVAEAEHGIGNLEHARQSLQHAEIGYATLLRFMSDPKHSKDITEQQRTELTARVEHLRSTLDQLAKAVKK